MSDIDWNKPLELMDGTPVVLSKNIYFGGTNPDCHGDYWIEREDGVMIRTVYPEALNSHYQQLCVHGNGYEEQTLIQVVRNRKEPTA